MHSNGSLSDNFIAFKRKLQGRQAGNPSCCPEENGGEKGKKAMPLEVRHMAGRGALEKEWGSPSVR